MSPIKSFFSNFKKDLELQLCNIYIYFIFHQVHLVVFVKSIKHIQKLSVVYINQLNVV